MIRFSRAVGEGDAPLLPTSSSISRSSSAQPSISWPDEASFPHLTYVPPRSRSSSFPTSSSSPSSNVAPEADIPAFNPDSPPLSVDPSPAPMDLSSSPFLPGGYAGRLLKFVARFPVVVMVLCLLPSAASLLFLLVPRGFDLSVDYTYDQFKIQGDPATVADDMNSAAGAASFFFNKPAVQTTQSWKEEEGAAFPALSNASTHTFTLSSLVSEVPPPSALSRSFHSTQAYIHRSYLGETLTVIYVADPSQGVRNLLSSSTIRRIRAIEKAIMSAPGYDSHCRVYYQGESKGQCILPSTLLNFIFASKLTDQTLVFDGRGSELMDPTSVATGLLLNGRNGFFDRRCSLPTPQTSTLISQFTFGLPLPGYADINDRLGQQRRQLSAWMVQFDGLLAEVDGKNGLRVLREGGDIVQAEIDAILARDLITVLFSIALVFAYMMWHTRSMFLTLASMVMMAASFPPCTLLYRLIFGPSMSLMNVVSVWLILGIGTDDVFIYVDMWAQYAHHRFSQGGKAIDVGDASSSSVDLSPAGLSARLSWTYRKAASAMLVTSFTTAAGFFSTSVSLLLPIRQFGFFLGFVVVFNYLLVISFFPAAVIAHAKYRRTFNQLLCCGQYSLVAALISKTLKRGPAQIEERDGEGRSRSPSPVPISEADAVLSEADWNVECSSIVSPPRSPTSVMELLNFGRAQKEAIHSPQRTSGRGSRLADLQRSLLGEEEKAEVDDGRSQAKASRISSLLSSVKAAVSGKGSSDPFDDPTAPSSSSAPLRDRAVSGYFSLVYRLRWLIFVGFALLVCLLTLRIPELETPSELPQILPPSSNVEQLRVMKKALACDRCVQGGLDVEPNNAPATCPISQCSDPANFVGCEDVDCGSGGICQLGACHCHSGYFGVRCDGFDVCYGHDCGMHGSCSNSSSSARCQCRDGWTGEGCEVAPICQHVQCGEFGLCSNNDGHCICLDGYTGSQCQTAPPTPPLNPNSSSTSLLPISADLSIHVFFLFGLSSVDMSNADNHNPGQPIYDPTFNPSTPAAQLHLLSFCQALLHNNSHARAEMFRCPILAYHQWMKGSQGVAAWPITPPSTFTSTFLQFMRSWESRDVETDVGFEAVPGEALPNGTTGAAGVRMTFMRVATLTFVDKDLSGWMVVDEYEWWKGWFEGWNERAPLEVKGVQTSATWPRMKTEMAFISGTLTSLLISILIVSLSILLFTGNLWLMAYTTVIIASIVLCLLGCFVLWGWPLGALEAISVPLVVGLSVDYCLHLSHAYTAAAKGDEEREEGKKKRSGSVAQERLAQTRRALLRIGPSITAAAVTTIACMAVLLSCRIVVFVQFGVVVAVTLTMGLVFTLTAFLAALQIAGPQRTQGDVHHAGKTAYKAINKAIHRWRGTQAPADLQEDQQGGEDSGDAREDSPRRETAASLEQKRELRSALLSGEV